MARKNTDMNLDPLGGLASGGIGDLDDLAAPLGGPDEVEKIAKAVEKAGLMDRARIEELRNNLEDESAVSLKHALLHEGNLSEADLFNAVAHDLGMETVDLDHVDFTGDLLDELTPEMAKKYNVVPVRATRTEVWVALADPNDLRPIDDLGRMLSKKVTPVIATEEGIAKAIKRFYEATEYAELYEKMSEQDKPLHRAEMEKIQAAAGGEDTRLVVQYVDLMFQQAVHDRASDIHIEPTKDGVIIRLRIDGVLQEIDTHPPAAWYSAIISRLKVMAGMDLAEKRIPLDGRIKLSIPGKRLDLRVSSLPTIFGESIVMRILDQSSVLMGLEDVGFLPDTVKTFNQLIRSPNGIILMTGPTGSGKTTTLYAALGVLNTPEHKLVTLEDPIEYQIAGINQVQINSEIGLNFASGLRALLRQSPDVILVGEIRDLETAENAIRAALTGHLVFSTLHTNDAPSATVRLTDMGVKPYLVASSLQAVLAQRLVRSICKSCKTAYEGVEDEIRAIGDDPARYPNLRLYKGAGCGQCGRSGYKGRTAIHETMVISSEIRRRIIRNEPSTRLKRYCVSQGMRTLRLDGWEKARLGQTTVEEVLRVVGGED